jgi:hypothetical protein
LLPTCNDGCAGLQLLRDCFTALAVRQRQNEPSAERIPRRARSSSSQTASDRLDLPSKGPALVVWACSIRCPRIYSRSSWDSPLST